MRKILGINISHNVSFAYFENNILKEYYEEDRFNKIKNYEPDENELANFNYEYKVLKKFKNIIFDAVVFSSHDRGHLQIELPIIKHFLKQVKCKKYSFSPERHHLHHAICGFYFSNFNEAIALVSDGGGECFIDSTFKTLQSIHLVNKNKIEIKYKFVSNKKVSYFNYKEKFNFEKSNNGIDYTISNEEKAGLKYLNYLEQAGFNRHEEGQMMGIAAYKNKETNLNKNVLEIANKAQEETLEDFVELIKRAKKYSDSRNIILSGGYHLNCSNNFKIVKKFPEYNFFVDPIAYDGGTAVGAAYHYENYL